jgi:hypothetical protein
MANKRSSQSLPGPSKDIQPLPFPHLRRGGSSSCARWTAPTARSSGRAPCGSPISAARTSRASWWSTSRSGGLQMPFATPLMELWMDGRAIGAFPILQACSNSSRQDCFAVSLTAGNATLKRILDGFPGIPSAAVLGSLLFCSEIFGAGGFGPELCSCPNLYQHHTFALSLCSRCQLSYFNLNCMIKMIHSIYSAPLVWFHQEAPSTRKRRSGYSLWRNTRKW